MLTKDIAICISAIDYSETSQIVTFFTRSNGKISAIAKGSRRSKSAFSGPIEILSFGRIVFSDTSKERLAALTEFEQQPGLIYPPVDLFALNCCLYTAELVNNLTHDNDPHPELFDSFMRFLQDTNREQQTRVEERNVLLLLILFQLTLFREIGLMPVLNRCANCKGRYEIQNAGYELYFSSTANGLVCRDCEGSFPDRIRLTRKAADCLTNLRQIAESDRRTLSEIEKVLVSHSHSLLGRPLKMTKQMLKNLNALM